VAKVWRAVLCDVLTCVCACGARALAALARACTNVQSSTLQAVSARAVQPPSHALEPGESPSCASWPRLRQARRAAFVLSCTAVSPPTLPAERTQHRTGKLAETTTRLDPIATPGKSPCPRGSKVAPRDSTPLRTSRNPRAGPRVLETTPTTVQWLQLGVLTGSHSTLSNTLSLIYAGFGSSG
jgi:hypothetical protein